MWGFSAARVHGAIPRAIGVGYAFGPTQHRPIALVCRAGQVQFRRRDPERLDVEYLNTELGPGLVTSIAQTILDLSERATDHADALRMKAIRTLMKAVDPDELADLAARTRGLAALQRARKVVSNAQ